MPEIFWMDKPIEIWFGMETAKFSSGWKASAIIDIQNQLMHSHWNQDGDWIKMDIEFD